MAYSELIKSFERIRDYMRQFYVYGFKGRSEYTGKSLRSYDNERRRIESYLGDYMLFRRDENGKKLFLSLDSRALPQNPLYRAYKAKSFTNGDIIFHFYVLDALRKENRLTVSGLINEIYNKLNLFDNAFVPDESPMAYKSMEYIAEQIKPTAKILSVIKPIYNFKAAE